MPSNPLSKSSQESSHSSIPDDLVSVVEGVMEFDPETTKNKTHIILT